MQETSSLCKVFLVYEQVQNHEKIQISDSYITSKSEAINPNHQLVVPDASNNMTNNGSTSKSKVVVIIPLNFDSHSFLSISLI